DPLMVLVHTLQRSAIVRGAHAITATATAVSRDSVTFDGGEVRAQVVAGGWGRWGRFDQQLERAFVRDRSHRNFGFKRHYRGDGAKGVIELYSFSHGYLGVSDVEDGITNICGLVHAQRLQGHKGKWDSF